MRRHSLSLMFFSTALLCMSQAQAAANVVLYSSSSDHLSHASTTFAVNPTSGKAWINLFVPQGFHTEELYERQLSVEGLRYDPTNQTIVYQSPTNTSVTCATVREHGKGWLKRTRITPTGQCPILQKQPNGQPLLQARLTQAQPVQLVFAPMLTSAP